MAIVGRFSRTCIVVACAGAWVACDVAHADVRVGAEADPKAQAQSAPAAPEASRPLGLPSAKARTTGAAPAQANGPADILRTGLSLGAVLALAVGGAIVFRRLARRQGGLAATLGAGGRAPSGILEVLGRYPVQRGLTLVLLRLDRRVLLLAQSTVRGAASMAPLCEITDPEEIASILVKTRDADGDSIAERFQQTLGDADRRTTDAIADGTSARRTIAGSSGDRAELLAEPETPLRSRGYSPAPGSAGTVTGAEALRRRLALLDSNGSESGGQS